MRLVPLVLLCPVFLPAQTPPASPALTRGVLLERDSEPSGEFSVRDANNQVFRYRFDAKTYVEREEQMINVGRLQPGEKVEVVSDTVPSSPLRYARTVHVLGDPPSRPSLTGARQHNRSTSYSADRYAYMGNLTYSGIVFRLTDERLVLRTRKGEESLLLRKDTRFIENGEVVEAADLKPNMRVFVRAGKDIYDELEVYQVMWGTILAPSEPRP